MYAKISGNTVLQFPYTFGDLRRDNPNVSFPKNISISTMNTYGMVGVLEGPKPTLGNYQRVQRNALPTLKDGGYWMIEYTAVDMFADTTDEDTGVITTKAEHEAAYQATLDTATAEANRKKRNELLAETDYFALSDVTMSTEMTTYRQALRDITTHESWPNLADADWPTKP